MSYEAQAGNSNLQARKQIRMIKALMINKANDFELVSDFDIRASELGMSRIRMVPGPSKRNQEPAGHASFW